MKPENKVFLEENRKHWITLRDAKYLRHLDGNTRSRMVQVMSEEFQPGYTADLWCAPCVSEMIATLYRRFEEWEAAQEKALQEVMTSINSNPPVLIQITEAEKQAMEEMAKALEEAANTTTVKPLQVQANFPSHKKHPRR